MTGVGLKNGPERGRRKEADAVKQVFDRARANERFRVYCADFSDYRIRSSQKLQNTWALNIIPLSLSCYVQFRILITSVRFSTNLAFFQDFAGYI